MIYEMVTQCINDLRTRWTNLQGVLTILHDALPVSAVSTRSDITAVLTRIESYVATIQDPHETGADLADVPTLLSNARDTLNDSRSLTLDPLNPNSPLVLLFIDGIVTSVRTVYAAVPTIVEAADSVSNRLSELQLLIDRCLQEIHELTAPEGGRASLAGIRGSVESLSAYPVLTQETGYGRTPPSPTSGVTNGSSLGQTIEGTLRDVLGWRPKVSDAKGFLAALTQSFNCKEIEGRTECTYSPRTYAVQVQADMGAVTGAQASLYARAKAALDQSLLILDRLYALDSAGDTQEVDAFRTIIRSELTELVNELGVEGGPRVRRIDSLFDQLRGENNFSFDPEQVQGQLQQMREAFGLTRDHVNTIEEEQNLTDFITLVDYVNSLKQSWDSQRRFFDRGASVEPFLGTQLVLVSRALAVVAESVQEIYFAMDSVFLGSAERQRIDLIFPDPKTPPIFVGELLAWVDRFASEEGPQLIQNAGKAGVRALFPTIDRLSDLVRDARIPPQDPNRLPAGYRTTRVQHTLEELDKYLRQTAELARKFPQQEEILAPSEQRLLAKLQQSLLVAPGRVGLLRNPRP